MDKQRLVMRLSDREMLSLDKVLRETTVAFDLTLQNEKMEELMQLSAEHYVPSEWSFDLFCLQDHFAHCRVSAYKDPGDSETNWRFEITHDAEAMDTARAFLSGLKSQFSRSLPAVFSDMEHLLKTVGDFTEMSIISLPLPLLLSTPKTVRRILHDYTPGEKIAFSDDRDYYPRKRRIEIRENVFKFVPIHYFEVFRQESSVVAVGIVEKERMGEPEQYLTVFCPTRDGEMLQERFGRDFDRMLVEDSEIRGGKFTGDQRVIKLKEKVSPDDIVMDENVRAILQREVFDFFSREEIYRKAGLPFKRGIALYGPPGTGKTMLAKSIVSTMEQTVIWVKADNLQYPADVDTIFSLARIGRPSVLIMEDIDFYAGGRDDNPQDHPIVASLMSHLDGLEENDGIIVIVTTNRIEAIEKAIIERPGRIDTRIYFGELGVPLIAKLLDKKLGGFARSFDNFEDLLPLGLQLTGTATLELATSIVMSAAEEPHVAGEISLRREHVARALKIMEKLNGQKKLGFAS